MSKAGVILSCIGTILSLISFLRTDKKSVGTWRELYERKDNYNVEAPIVYLGILLIIVGTILQCL